MRQVPFDAPDQDWLGREDVLAALQVGPKLLAKLIADGRFPHGVRASGRGQLRWPARDVAAYLWLLSRGAGAPADGDEEE